MCVYVGRTAFPILPDTPSAHKLETYLDEYSGNNRPAGSTVQHGAAALQPDTERGPFDTKITTSTLMKPLPHVFYFRET